MAFSSGLNEVYLMGRIYPSYNAETFELKTTPSGVVYVKGTIAVERDAPRNQQEHETKKQYDYITFVAWRGIAEFIGKYLNKGQRIFVKGKWQTGNYTDKTGRKVYTNDLKIERINAFDKTTFGEDNIRQYKEPNETADRFEAREDTSLDGVISPDDLPF